MAGGRERLFLFFPDLTQSSVTIPGPVWESDGDGVQQGVLSRSVGCGSFLTCS